MKTKQKHEIKVLLDGRKERQIFLRLLITNCNLSKVLTCHCLHFFLSQFTNFERCTMSRDVVLKKSVGKAQSKNIRLPARLV